MRNFFLFLAAVLLALVSVVVGVPAKIIQCLRKKSSANDWFYRLAKSLDQFGNVAGDDFWTLAFLKKNLYAKFGSEDELISSVIGKNYISKNLTVTGELLRRVLHFFDRNHAVESIESDENA